MDQNSIENRKRCANTLRRHYITVAVASGLTRDLKLTWDGGHDSPSLFAKVHVAEFHARGRIIRESIPGETIASAWRTDDSLSIVRRVVDELLKY